MGNKLSEPIKVGNLTFKNKNHVSTTYNRI